jgi:hypothetical protein
MKALRIGPPLLCLVVGVSRAVWLATEIGSVGASTLAHLLLADVPVFGLLGILLGLEAVLPRHWRPYPLLVAVFLTVVYLLDVAAVVALNARLQIADIARFGVEWWLLPSYVNGWSLAGLFGVGGAFLIRARLQPRAVRVVVVLATATWLAPLAVPERAIPPHLYKYTSSVLGMGRQFVGLAHQPMPRYTVEDYEAYRDGYDALFRVPFAASRRSVVLVIVESLSAADSARTSGIGALLGRFDDLSREGMLFTNFLANFEASEGGIISLVSGVPPLHFPTASTDTFAEYSQQRSVTQQFAREGYRCEFLTSVPLRFISMDRYTTSPSVGFHFAGGQREIARFHGAPRYGFESPSDHLLYEEVLHRLGTTEGRRQQPVLIAVVTASSHPPYVDPRGRANTAANVWGYVQDELWWLYEQLKQRGFFEDGLLIITGDHRKMVPVTERERARYGDSAKARMPLVIIGAGVPAAVVDERLFQQADLLRMLDRALQPDQGLSPFALWVERYVYVFGVASNASRVEIFEARDQGRRGHQLHLRGAEIEWIDAPAQAAAIEGTIHRQRVAQQAQRAANVREEPIEFGLDLEPSDGVVGMLVGHSNDVDPRRDPDDPGGALTLFSAASIDEDPPGAPGASNGLSTVTVRGFLPIQTAGEYWFSAFSQETTCLAIDKRMVLGCARGLREGSALLTAGLHHFDLRFVRGRGVRAPELRWLPVGASKFAVFPQELLWQPRPRK